MYLCPISSSSTQPISLAAAIVWGLGSAARVRAAPSSSAVRMSDSLLRGTRDPANEGAIPLPQPPTTSPPSHATPARGETDSGLGFPIPSAPPTPNPPRPSPGGSSLPVRQDSGLLTFPHLRAAAANTPGPGLKDPSQHWSHLVPVRHAASPHPEMVAKLALGLRLPCSGHMLRRCGRRAF